MMRREAMALGAAALASPLVVLRVGAAVSARRGGLLLHDSHYPRSAAIVTSASASASASGSGGQWQRGPWQDLHGADPVRLWRAQLLPALNAGTLVTGCSTYATWQVLRYSALEARHGAHVLPLATDDAAAVTLIAWQLLPRRPRPQLPT